MLSFHRLSFKLKFHLTVLCLVYFLLENFNKLLFLDILCVILSLKHVLKANTSVFPALIILFPTMLSLHQWRSGSVLEAGRREVPGSILDRVCRPSRSEFSVVFSETRVNRC